MAVLKSPIDTIVDVLQNANRDPSNEDEEAINCELAELKCNNDALLTVLPF